MSVDALRGRLKSGPLADVYARLRQAKRRLRHEPVAGPLLPENTPFSVEELRRMVPLLPDHARLLYSLGLQYLAHDQPEDMPKALACLRSAETLRFESPERIALYTAWIAAKSSRLEEAQRQIVSLEAYELTAEENALREAVQQGRVKPLQTNPASSDQEAALMNDDLQLAEASSVPVIRSVLVIGDAKAITADWFAGARYLLADPRVTGLTLQAAASLGIDFDTALGPAEMRITAQLAGLTFSRWKELY